MGDRGRWSIAGALALLMAPVAWLLVVTVRDGWGQ